MKKLTLILGLGLLATGASIAALPADDRVPAPRIGALVPLMDRSYMIAAPGRVEPASEEIHLGSAVTGRLKEVRAREGDRVTSGQILAMLENDDLHAGVARAEAELLHREAELQRLLNGARVEERREARAGLREAEAIAANAVQDLGRRQTLRAQGHTSQEQADRAERESAVARARVEAARERLHLLEEPPRAEDVAMAKANVALARAQRDEARAHLNKTLIRAPVDGTVLRQHRKAGELISVFQDMPILTVGDIDTLVVRADVDEADIGRIRVGLPVHVTADAFGAERFEGKVVRVGRMLGRKNFRSETPGERVDTKVLETFIELAPTDRLMPGLRVNVFIMPERASAMAEPASPPAQSAIE